MQPETTEITRRLESIRQMVQACIQCGTCTASCPNEFAMDLTPRRLWRMVLMGLQDDIFQSRTFSLCSSCYTCTLRCPRGLPLTGAMSALKQLAYDQGLSRYRSGDLFYGNFMRSVRRHGRVREMEFMTLYFVQLKNPMLPFRFAPLGLKLMAKGKVPMQVPSKGAGKLESLFKQVEKVQKEERSGEVS